MGEGRRDRSSRRHRANLGIEKSSSDTEVGRSNAKSRKNRGRRKREKWPFLEGLTVDELGRYRRRRFDNHPRDTLGGAQCRSSDATDETPVTEYRRAFRAISEDSILSVLKSPVKKIGNDGKVASPSVHAVVAIASEEPLGSVEKSETEIAGAAEQPPPPPPKPVEKSATRVSESPLKSVEKSVKQIGTEPPLQLVEKTAKQIGSESPLQLVEKSATRLTEPPLKSPVEKSATRVTEQLLKPAVEKSAEQSSAMETAVGLRPPLMRRATSLRREGDEFYGNTEYSRYVSHEGAHRAELARRPTSLRMEGNMADTRTEQCEKFVEWLNVTRPELARIPTNLKLEGDIERLTENHDKYVPFVGARRPELLRQTAHLKLEGESNFLPEYTDVFREHRIRADKRMHQPASHLKTGGEFREKTENTANYGEPGIDVQVAAGERPRGDPPEADSTSERERQKEQDMRMLVSKLEDLKGSSATPQQIPEYKDAYKDFPRERPKLMRPEDEIGRADGTKIHSSASHARFPTKIDQDLEYRSKFLDRDRAVYRKPPMSLRRPSVAASSSSSAFDGGRGSRDYHHHHRRRHAEATSEVRSQYIPYGQVPRVETLKMPANLRLEGNIDLHPEYRDAYCSKRDYAATLREPRAHRHRDRSLSGSRRRAEGGCWINSNNSEQFGQINAADDQDAFQLLTTKVHEESIVGKPPPASRRATHLDIASPSAGSTRNRSPSPSYRLQVQNVDDVEPRGFERRARRSPVTFNFGEADHQRHRSPSPSFPDHRDHHHQHHHRHHHHHQEAPQRAYSPSFGAGQHRIAAADGGGGGGDEHAFVVLDNAANRNAPFNPTVVANRSRRMLDRNCNNVVVAKSPRGRPRNRTPTNWMPPWYDNTNTI